MQGFVKAAIGAALFFAFVFLYHPTSITKVQVNLKKRVNPLIKWKNCMLEETKNFPGRHDEAWFKWSSAVGKCEQQLVGSLLNNISEFSNEEEIKYHIMPKENSPTTLVTLGIGRNIIGEQAIFKAFGNKSIKFYGADPIYEGNDKLYTQLGAFFPFAVGGNAGFQTASVFINEGYSDKVVVHVDLVYFLLKMIKETFYDTIWMDAENGEYGMFPFLLKGGDLEKNGITVCQWNMEIHRPNSDQRRLANEFLLQTLNDERYAIVKLLEVTHLRVYMVNYEDPGCLKKYLPEFI